MGASVGYVPRDTLYFSNLINTTQASILVDQLGRARVGDFTFATIATSQDTLQGTHCGATVLDNLPARWTAPEVLNEKRPLSKKSDVFSFAMVMYAVSSINRNLKPT